MKKVFMLLACVALVAGVSCKKHNTPEDPSKDSETTSTDPAEAGYVEKTWTFNFEWDETAGYGMEEFTLPGEEIADFFGLSQEEFFKGMGTLTGDSSNMSTAQENNNILFGLAEKNNTDNLKWVPSTTNNFGHWYSAEGAATTWGSDTDLAVFYIESTCATWGAESPTAEDLEAQWGFVAGVFPGRAEGDKAYKATVVYFYTDDDDVEYYAYVEINVKIKAVAQLEFSVVQTQELSYTLDYSGEYLHTPFQDDIDAEAIKAAIGIEMADATVYPVNADGTFDKFPGVNFWFSKEGDKSSWGEGCGIDLGNNEFPEEAPVWCICNFPDPSLAGATVKAAIAFCNPENLKAYLLKVNVTFNEILEILPDDVEQMHDAATTIDMEISSDWNEQSINDICEDAFQITAEQFKDAITAGQVSARLFVGEEEVEPTAGGFVGNWFDINGNVCNFDSTVDEQLVRSYYVEFYDNYSVGIGFYDSDSAGVHGKTIDTYKQEITFSAGGKNATVTISYKLTFTYVKPE